MAEVIAYGPLLDPDVLAGLIGHRGAAENAPSAEIGGHVAVEAGDRLLPVLAARAGGATAGRALALAPDDLARLDFGLGALGLVRATPEAARADTYLPETPPGPAAPPWDAEDWARHRRALLIELIDEIMAFFGTHDPAAVRRLVPTLTARALARVRGAATTTPVERRSGLGTPDIQTLSRERPYRAFFAVEEHALRHRRFDGRTSEPIHRAVFVNGDAVTLVPYDPVGDSVLLIEQFRIGPHARRDPVPWCLEAIAGRCDSVEPPETVARREAREEAGLEIGRMERIAGYYSTPGVTSEFITAYAGEARLDGAGGNFGLAHEHEDIRALVLPLDDALALVESGEANNGPLLISLLWLACHRERLRHRWLHPAGPTLDGSRRNG